MRKRNFKPLYWVCLLLISKIPIIAGDHPWPVSGNSNTLEQRFTPPAGFKRVSLNRDSFGSWLRKLPIKAGKPPVYLYDGRLKPFQQAQVAVIDIDTGEKDLQQCADAVIRLRAEYLYAMGRHESIVFHFTSGDPARWQDWRAGGRPIIRGNKVSWVQSSGYDAGYANFRRYLEKVFIYAGSWSLSRHINKVTQPAIVAPGDFFLQGGFPGHAVIVVDAAENALGERVFLPAQSYMPAQDIHILKNPANPTSPWYKARSRGKFDTPEWPNFKYSELYRFPR